MEGTSTPPGIILVAHEVLASIPRADIAAALPEGYQRLPQEVVYLTEVRAQLKDLGSLNWESARRRQTQEIQERLLPLLKKLEGWRIQYFGAAPIPLAMSFGFMIGGFAKVDVYQQRHDTQSWKWSSSERSKGAEFTELALPAERLTAPGELIIRLSISHTIDPAETEAIVPANLGELDIALKVPNEDALESRADLEELKKQFDRAIDWAHRARPNAQIHVFAALPVGAAFRLGTAINPTIHAPVHLYQYTRGGSPRYKHAMVLQRAGSLEMPLTDEEARKAAEFRQLLKIELEKMQSGCERLKPQDRTQTWLNCALPEIENSFFGALARLPPIHATPIAISTVDIDTTQVEGGFSYDTGARQWRFDDRLLVAMIRRFPQIERRKQAGRLLILHESVHLEAHGLTEATAQQIRRFPKIVEELDYQADVWAYVHDYALDVLTGTVTARDYFLGVVEVGLETFWAFDADADLSQIEIRRINRYLIWYWQLLRIEHCSDLTAILRTLAERPLIEIAGPQVETDDDRVFYSLDPVRIHDAQIAHLFDNRLGRYGNSLGSRVSDVLRGFRERNPEMIREALKSIFDQLPRRPQGQTVA